MGTELKRNREGLFLNDDGTCYSGINLYARMLSDGDTVKSREYMRLPEIFKETKIVPDAAGANVDVAEDHVQEDDVAEDDLPSDEEPEEDGEAANLADVEEAPEVPVKEMHGWKLYYARDDIANRHSSAWTKKLEEMRARHAFAGVKLMAATSRESIDDRVKTQQRWARRKGVQVKLQDRLATRSKDDSAGSSTDKIT